MSSGWSLTRVVSHQGSLTGRSLRWSVIRGGLSSGLSVIRVVCHQGGLWSVIRVVCHQDGLSSGWSVVWWSLIRLVFHQGNLSARFSLIRDPTVLVNISMLNGLCTAGSCWFTSYFWKVISKKEVSSKREHDHCHHTCCVMR